MEFQKGNVVQLLSGGAVDDGGGCHRRSPGEMRMVCQRQASERRLLLRTSQKNRVNLKS